MKSVGSDPFLYGEKVRTRVTRNSPKGRERLYKAAPSSDPRNKDLVFRVANYYLGTAVADCIGCNLRCKYCWAVEKVQDYSIAQRVGKFYSPLDVASALMNVARAYNLKHMRITQGEPTLDQEHLLGVLDELNVLGRDIPFILETNGLILGKDNHLAKDLTRYSGYFIDGLPGLHVRVSLKGATRRLFHEMTGADERFHDLQFKALENCMKHEISVHPAIMLDFITSVKQVRNLQRRLQMISPNLVQSLEFERLFLDKEVRNRLDLYKIKY